MSLDNEQQRLSALRKEYGQDGTHHPGWWNLSEALAENSSSNRVLEALLRGFESGMIPAAFESIMKNGSGEVICEELARCFYDTHAPRSKLKLLKDTQENENVKLNFTADSEGRLCMMEGKYKLPINHVRIWTEEVDFQGNGVVFTPNPNFSVGVSVILKRTPMYLVQANENNSTLVKLMTDYYHWVWCLSEKGIDDTGKQVLGEKHKKCAGKHRKGLDQDLVRRIAEFVGPAPVLWLEEGDILLKIGVCGRRWHQMLVRPRKGPH